MDLVEPAVETVVTMADAAWVPIVVVAAGVVVAVGAVLYVRRR